MAVQDRNADTLAGDHGRNRRNDLSVLHLSPDPERFLLALLLLSADVRNNVLYHLRPVLEGFAGAGDRLVGGHHRFIGLELFPGAEYRSIALYGAVRLYCYKTSGGPQSLLLGLDHFEMLRIDLRNDHRYIRSPAMRTVIGYHRSLGLRIGFLDRPDLFF